jgi:hypothetical protein
VKKEGVSPGTTPPSPCGDRLLRKLTDPRLSAESRPAVPTTCIETIDGDSNTAIRLSFQIKVF